MVLGPNVDRYFAAGRTPAPFSLVAAGEVTLRAIDAGAQENGRVARWSGPGALRVTGPAIDLSRQTTGDMAILMRYRIDAPAAGAREPVVACGRALRRRASTCRPTSPRRPCTNGPR